MHKTKSAGGIVINQGKVLVVSQHGNSWSLPKGIIEPGESDLEAAKREILEESGVSELVLVKDLGSYKRYRIGLDGKDNKEQLKIIHLFLFTTTQKTLKPIDPENPEARWVDKEKVAELLTHKKDKEFYNSKIKELKA